MDTNKLSRAQMSQTSSSSSYASLLDKPQIFIQPHAYTLTWKMSIVELLSMYFRVAYKCIG